MLQLSVEEYQVGWICVLPCEYATAKAMLDEQHQMVSEQHPADSNSYTLGRVHNHNVVIACLPAGVDGANAAAVVATNLSRTFRSVRFGLMVGIGGGIPDLRKAVDIRLGDVVVSQPGVRYGGVVQYDKGKSYDDNRFERKGQLNKPPTVLLTALSNLKAEHDIEDSHIAEYLEQMVQNRPKMQRLGYSFPAEVTDVLRCSHDANKADSCEHCEDGEVKREPRQSTEPVIHYGIIASGNQVIKSAVHRDQIRDECGDAICVEMEAAGIMDDFPSLVIRGICDYADSVKNDKWHKYAAATAAAFAKELLSFVSAKQTGHERPIQEIFGFVTDAREHFRHQDEHNRQQQAHQQWQEMHAHHQEIQRIPIVARAMYGSHDEVYQRCHPNTRVDIRCQIQQWATQPHSKPILWLVGQAGTGKSTISSTFAEWLVNQDHPRNVSLGASYFFKRGDGDRASAGRFFPTIIRQLITKIPGLDALVIEAIKSNPLIFDTALAEQFRQLMLYPLSNLSNADTYQTTLVVLVDALDECERQSDIQTILKLWSQISHLRTIRLRLFLTSRPELPIRLEFQHMPTSIFQDIDLVEAVSSSTIEQDLHVYLEDSFLSIRKDHNSCLQHASGINTSWPGQEAIQQLVDIAKPLFIIASTIIRFVGDLELDPRENLEEILTNRNIGQMSQMELVYLPVLNHLITPAREESQQKKLYQDFHVVVGSIILLAEALSVSSLSTLLAIECRLIDRRLAPLHSVLRVPNDYISPIRTLHLSFAEFLLSERTRAHPFSIDGPSTHSALGTHCLRVLSNSSGGLHENICGLDYPGRLRREVESSVVNSRLTPAVQYACRHWVHHIKRSYRKLVDNGEVHSFLRQHFLHWLEALSLMDRIADVHSLLDDLKSCTWGVAPDLWTFVYDAQRFILGYRHIIDLAPLQLYSSAIIFSPQNSLVRRFCGRIPAWIQSYPKTDLEWGPELQTLEGHTGTVTDVSCSPKGPLLASASWDGTIRLWDTRTGRQVQKLEGHSGPVHTVSFSPDGSLLVSSSDSMTVRLWDVQTGREVQKLESQVEVTDMSFSPDSCLLALACSDGTISLRHLQIHRAAHTLKGHPDHSVKAVSFSPNGSLLASGGDDETVRLWDMQTLREVQAFENNPGAVEVLSFSPDGSLLASVTSPKIWLWHTQTGQVVQRFQHHSYGVNHVSFSPDSTHLASAPDDSAIWVWEVRDGQYQGYREPRKLLGHTRPATAVSFTFDGALLASGSWDQTIRIWDIRNGLDKAYQDTPELNEDTGSIEAMSFSHDGSLLAVASWYRVLQVWNTKTGQEVHRFSVGRARRCGSSVGIALSFSLDGSLLAIKYGKEELRVRHILSGQAVYDPSILGQSLFDLEEGKAQTRSERYAVLGDWILKENRKLLWLPHEYRGSKAVFQGDMVAIGANSGRPSIFRFNFP